jgi:hypothetical protein
MAQPRPAETPPMSARTNTSHTDKCCEKNIAGAPTLLQGFEGYTRGCASAPPRNITATRREEHPISKRQPLWVPNGYHRRGSGATVRDGHEGPLITGNKPLFRKNNKTQTNPQIIEHTQHNRSPVRGAAHGPSNLSGSSSGSPLEQTSTSLEGWMPPRANLRLTRGMDAPSGESPPSSRDRCPPRANLHLARGLYAPSGESPPRSRPPQARGPRACSPD